MFVTCHQRHVSSLCAGLVGYIRAAFTLRYMTETDGEGDTDIQHT